MKSGHTPRDFSCPETDAPCTDGRCSKQSEHCCERVRRQVAAKKTHDFPPDTAWKVVHRLVKREFQKSK
jgi:hypothetical protein